MQNIPPVSTENEYVPPRNSEEEEMADIWRTIIARENIGAYDNFFEIAKGYPFGIVRSGDEHVIRDPLTVNENGELVCVGQVEENTLVSIMKGNKDSLIIAAEEAAIESMKKAINPKKAIIVDCISRILFLEEKFNLELDKITSVLRERSPIISISGALTLGEISSYGNGYLEFYNKTVVVGLFE